MKITKYTIKTEKLTGRLRFACVSDLHARPYNKVLKALDKIRPDAILMPGDILEIAIDYMERRNLCALDFLKHASEICPCFYTFGNHELYYSHSKGKKSKVSDNNMASSYMKKIQSYGINLVNDDFKKLQGRENVLVGGIVCGKDMNPLLNEKTPDLKFIEDFSGKVGFKILLCHYPHYYQKYLKDSDFDLVLSGHAHGGQWRIFGQGIFAPHQGLFPKYTSGIYDGKHIISRGAANNVLVPRFFNPTEVLQIDVIGI